MTNTNEPQIRRRFKKHRRIYQMQTFDLTPSIISFSSLLKPPLAPQPPQPIQQDKPLSEVSGEVVAAVLKEAWKQASPDTFAGYRLMTDLAASPHTPPEFKGWLNFGAFLALLQGGCDTAQFIRKELRQHSRH